MDRLLKTESIAVAFTMGILPPLLLFIFFWWAAATLSITQVLRLPDSTIAATAFTGLFLGIVLDVRYLRMWIPQFYRVNLRVMALVYLCCSVVAVAMFMGLPVGNIALGTVAGAYIGRRECHAARSKETALKLFRQVSFFTAAVTGVEALLIGLLALNEDWVVEWLQGVSGLAASAIAGWFGLGLIVLLCVVLMVVQFWCTNRMACTVFGFGRPSITWRT